MRPFRIARRASIAAVYCVAVLLLAALPTAGARAASTPASASATRRIDDFLGLWQGVDPLDGSPVRLSLSDIDDDGVIEVTQQEDFFSVCHAQGSDFTKGTGVVVGTATLAKSKDTLDVESDLICIDDDGGQHPLAGGEPHQYLLRSRGRNLVLPEFGDAPAIVLHRTAP
jgi:hypothetical protein